MIGEVLALGAGIALPNAAYAMKTPSRTSTGDRLDREVYADASMTLGVVLFGAGVVFGSRTQLLLGLGLAAGGYVLKK